MREIGYPAKAMTMAVAAAFILSGCATIMSGREQVISLDTVNVKGATCRGEDQAGAKYVWTNTPSSTTVIKGDGPLIIKCEAKGFKLTTLAVQEGTSGAVIGNILTLGLGALVDAASGAAQPYPTVVKMVLEPGEGASKAAVAEYKAFVKQLKEDAKQAKEDEIKQIEAAGG